MADYSIGEKVRLKKTHPCGGDVWTIIRAGMDFRIKCDNCGRSILLPRSKFEKSVKEHLRES